MGPREQRALQERAASLGVTVLMGRAANVVPRVHQELAVLLASTARTGRSALRARPDLLGRPELTELPGLRDVTARAAQQANLEKMACRALPARMASRARMDATVTRVLED